MEIKIKGEDDERKVELVFSDEGLDNDNFVDVKFEGQIEATFSISDLLAACEAFQSLRMIRLCEEDQMK